jgi:hypothetical protein
MVLKTGFLALAVASLAAAYRLERRDNVSDIDTIIANVNAFTFQTYLNPGTAEWLTTLQADGSFSDVNYATGTFKSRNVLWSTIH